MLLEAVNVAALFVMSMAAAYFFLAAGLGVRELRRRKVPLGDLSEVGYGHPWAGDAHSQGWHIYFLIPCLDEAAVIGETVRTLRDPSGRARILVVDDGSSDGTGQVARAAGGDQVTVVRRSLPNAKQGKGAALNAAFAVMEKEVEDKDLDPDRVIVVVMDADGHLSDGAMSHVLPLFDDETVGGVQLAVRIRNRSDNFLLEFQDHQFWTLSSLTQYGRIGTRSVSLGGNGQFTRLTALRQLGTEPWSASLTEDLDLAISLGIRGWNLTTTPNAAVDQQGVSSLRALVRQRTRWYQGHMTAGRRLPEVLQSDRTDHATAIEMTLYLLVPWVFDLPWSILYHVIVAQILFLGPGLDGLGTNPGGAAVVALWYLLGFWPALVTAVMAKRRDRSLRWPKALKLGHCFVVTNYLSYVCAWRALGRMLTGRTGWTKTARLTEAVPAVLPRTLGAPLSLRPHVPIPHPPLATETGQTLLRLERRRISVPHAALQRQPAGTSCPPRARRRPHGAATRHLGPEGSWVAATRPRAGHSRAPPRGPPGIGGGREPPRPRHLTRCDTDRGPPTYPTTDTADNPCGPLGHAGDSTPSTPRRQ